MMLLQPLLLLAKNGGCCSWSPIGDGSTWGPSSSPPLCGVMASFFVSFLWKRNRALKVIGDTDSLTGVYNRKGGDEAVASYLHEHPEVSPWS